MEEERILNPMPQMCPYMQQNPYMMQGMYTPPYMMYPQHMQQPMSGQMAYPLGRDEEDNENISSEDDYRRSRSRSHSRSHSHKHCWNDGCYSNMYNPYWYSGYPYYNCEHGHHHR